MDQPQVDAPRLALGKDPPEVEIAGDDAGVDAEGGPQLEEPHYLKGSLGDLGLERTALAIALGDRPELGTRPGIVEDGVGQA